MTSDRITEIRVDDAGQLCVVPETQTFPFVYRAGMEVRWDELGRFLHSPPPREWPYVRWFQQIVAAVVSEYGCSLSITPQTRWNGVHASQQAAILAATRTPDARALQRTAAPLGSWTVRVIWQRPLQPTGRFRRRSLSLVVRRHSTSHTSCNNTKSQFRFCPVGP